MGIDDTVSISVLALHSGSVKLALVPPLKYRTFDRKIDFFIKI
jgi:sRNA-binding carbon storage regulator CsrA